MTNLLLRAKRLRLFLNSKILADRSAHKVLKGHKVLRAKQGLRDRKGYKGHRAHRVKLDPLALRGYKANQEPSVLKGLKVILALKVKPGHKDLKVKPGLKGHKA